MIAASEVVDRKPKDVFIADFFRAEIMSGRIKKGDKLLSDEKIARKYKLNKRTVASGLNSLVRDGLLSRAPRRGTIVIKDFSTDENNAKSSENVSEELASQEHKVSSPYGMDYLFFIPETKTLTFASFETLPPQQKMWRKLIADFNAKSKGRKVVLESIHIDNFSQDGTKLHKYMAAKNSTPDIVQSVLFNTSPANLIDLPDDLLAYTTGEDSLSANVLPDFKSYLKKIVPVYTSVPVCVWNKEMEAASGIKSLKENIIAGNLVKALCASASNFPGSLNKIGPHLNNLLRHYGLPLTPDAVSVEYFRGFFDNIFAGLRLLKEQNPHKIFIENHGYKSYENFSRKKHFLIETLSNPPHYPDKEYLEFELGTAIFPPKQDLLMELSSLGIAKESTEPEFASDFLRFVTSHESQLFMHTCINGIPYRKSALDSLPEINPQITRPEIDIIYDKIKFAYYPWQKYFTVDVISYAMIELFEGIVNGEINSSAMAADTAYQIFTKHINKMKE
jgi:ABC-type glycerol-3-phosphate transport system substrate-binding protein